MSSKRTVPRKRPAKVKALKQAQATSGFQFKITLLGSKPAIWRRFQVPDCTLGELHIVIQNVMGWEDAHLHQFIVGKDYYGVPHPDDDFGLGPKIHDEDECRISEIIPVKARVFRMVYEYDFGDSWEHGIELEKRLTADDFVGKPICLEGSRACPLEDCGGIWGYEGILQLIKHKDDNNLDEEDLERLEWIGEDFDPESYSVEEVNEWLKKCYG